ncbi:MAG: chloride channel protein [Pseudoflavonifractor sp.]|nr:chloride channel protein [Alloprevotella sp.]MCM1117311.1 chloride channel protein [Pseudoflavonifractor sp.]
MTDTLKQIEKHGHPRHSLFTLRQESGEGSVFVGICLCLGIAAGTGAFALKKITAWVSFMATLGLAPDSPPWRLLILPLAGIILAGVFQHYILRNEIDHGTDRINEALVSRKLLMPFSTTFSPIIGAAITLGLGGSAGSEGPIAYAGSAMGSRLAHFLRMPPERMAALVAIGAGAGIAGIFKAPIGGFLFVAEVLAFSFNTISVVGLATACVAAGVTAYTLSGFTPDIVFAIVPPFTPSMLLWALPLGVVSGFYSAYYSSLMNRITHLLEHLHHWPKWIISGSLLALLLFFLPALYGEGYQVIASLLGGSGPQSIAHLSLLGHLLHGLSPVASAVVISGAIAAVKVIGAAVTNSGGGVAGDFAPTIFAGAIVGFCFAGCTALIAPAQIPAAALVFMGMGGVMSGAVRAPLMAMFLVAEMTGAFTLFMPMAITSAISYLIVAALDHKRITRHA